MNIEDIGKLAQSCVQHNPVIVLGSGASVPHGIRGMTPLADALIKNVKPAGVNEEKAWALIQDDLGNGVGLEDALQKTASPPSLVEKIVRCTWSTIASDDLALLQRAATGAEALPLTSLLHALFKSTNNTIHIVTPNYDRIAEYAADLAGAFHATGFVPGFIRRREGADVVSLRRGNYAARTARIWKVHGSLDWFEDSQGQVVSLPLSDKLPAGLSPMIVTPGVSKYERTYDEPFRSAIQGADSALGSANAVLCVGFGFRDRHIEPRLVERCRQKNVPIVVLARTLTDEAKNFLNANAGKSYLAMEQFEDGTRVFTSEFPEGITIAGQDLWSFPGFNNLVL